jgi:O-antigen/teichoic acid export membrane protein
VSQLVNQENDHSSNRKLLQRVTQGGVWVFSLRACQLLFSMTRITILARILAPNDFGIMGISMLTMATLETFSQTGFEHALIQKKEGINKYLDTAWTILVVRGVILFGILYLIAPYVATFFGVAEVKLIIRVISFSILLQGLTNIGVIYFQKELQFNKQFFYHLSGILIDFIVAVSAVLILRSVWALVFGSLAGNAVRCVSSYLIHPYRPRLSVNLEHAKELFSFGKWVLGSSILFILIIQGDDIFVGKLLGVASLGFYQLAYKISSMATTEISHVISQVSFPTYSILQHEPVKLRESYLRVLRLTSFLALPIAGFIFAASPIFVTVFFGEKWMPMVPVMKILAIAGMARSIMATTGPVFRAIGKPRIETEWQIVRFILLACFIYPLAKNFNIVGVSYAVLISTVVATIGFSYKVISQIHCTTKEFLSALILPLANTMIIIAGINIMYRDLAGSSVYKLALCVVFSFLSTMFLSMFFWKGSREDSPFILREVFYYLKGSRQLCKKC